MQSVAGEVLFFHLAFRQRRLAVGAPVRGLDSLAQQSFLRQSAENTQLRCFVLGLHGQIRTGRIAGSSLIELDELRHTQAKRTRVPA